MVTLKASPRATVSEKSTNTATVPVALSAPVASIVFEKAVQKSAPPRTAISGSGVRPCVNTDVSVFAIWAPAASRSVVKQPTLTVKDASPSVVRVMVTFGWEGALKSFATLAAAVPASAVIPARVNRSASVLSSCVGANRLSI